MESIITRPNVIPSRRRPAGSPSQNTPPLLPSWTFCIIVLPSRNKRRVGTTALLRMQRSGRCRSLCHRLICSGEIARASTLTAFEDHEKHEKAKRAKAGHLWTRLREFAYPMLFAPSFDLTTVTTQPNTCRRLSHHRVLVSCTLIVSFSKCLSP